MAKPTRTRTIKKKPAHAPHKTPALKHAQKPVSKTEANGGTWINNEIFLKLATVFLATEVLGLFVAKALFAQGLQQAPFAEDINDILNAFYLFGVIIFMTIVILLALKMKHTKKMLWVVEALAIFATSTIVMSAFFPTNDLVVLGTVALLLILRYTNRKNLMIRNLASVIAVAGAGAFLGISLGLFPVVAFAIILAIYDIIAVFYTKHMVTIGKQSLENNFAFTIAMPTKEHKFELGNGDLVIPLMIASSVLVNGPFLNNGIMAGISLSASYIGLVLSIYSVSKWKKPMPALPPQTALIVIAILIGLALGL